MMRTGVAGFQSGRLKQLRLAFGLTQSGLAELVGRASGNISKWENGLQAPEADAFHRLCEVFGVSQNWLVESPVHSDAASPFFFRSNVTATETAREIAAIRLSWLQEISFKLQESLEFPDINVPCLYEQNCELISDAEIEQVASACRQAWGLGNGPIPHVIDIMERAGIVCARSHLGFLKMDGVSNWCLADDRPYALIIADKANGLRNRFDAAHELGHIVLHRHVTQTQYVEKYALLETQAHRFASAFLLPAESFCREVRWPTLDTLLALKPRWKVSVAAMVRRCQDLDIINETTATRLWKARSARGWVKGEPLDDTLQHELPSLLSQSIKMMVESKVLSRSQLRQVLGLPTDTLESLCSLEQGYFELPDAARILELRVKRQPISNPSFKKPAQVLGFPAKH